MNSELNGACLLDEIDRLFVSYGKAQEYLTKISDGIQKDVEFWQNRRSTIVDQMGPVSVDILLPKTQRMNDLIIEAVQNLCRVDILIEQVVRLEPKLPTVHRTHPMSSSFSARSIAPATSPSMNYPHFPPVSKSATPRFNQPTSTEPISNLRVMNQTVLPNSGPTRPALPVTIAQVPPPSTASGRFSTFGGSELFQPIQQQSQYLQQEASSARTNWEPLQGNRTQTPSTTASSRPLSVYSDKQEVRVKLQRIQPGTRWEQARIRVIDTLSAFYVENLEPQVHDTFTRLMDDLNKYYNSAQRSNRLQSRKQVAIGDFGVTQFGEDNSWYRARVVSHEENDQIKVLDIDSGNLESKFIDEFFPLDRKFADLPTQAIACTLSQACPPSHTEESSLWPQETIDIFRREVSDRVVKVEFDKSEPGVEAWPLHFVQIIINNQSLTNKFALKQLIDPRSNNFIAEQLSATLVEAEYILFNVEIGDEANQG